MNKRVWLWGGAILAGLILIGLLWPGKPPAPIDVPVKPAAKPPVKFVHHLQFPPEEVAPVTQQDTSQVEANAANIYREAFALYDALSQANKDILKDWQTNVDAVVEAELCEQLRPICDLMHQAAAMTNCDWGIGPLTFETKLPQLAAGRGIARATIWSATHCRSNNVPVAAEDVISVVHLGRQLSQLALIGCLVDMAVQNSAMSCVATNLDWFNGAAGQQLAAAIAAAEYGAPLSHALDQEAGAVESVAGKIAALPVVTEKDIASLTGLNLAGNSTIDPATVVAQLKQVADFTRNTATSLSSGSAVEYETWLQQANELSATNIFAKLLLPVLGVVVQKAQAETVNQALVLAGVAVTTDGPAALAAHPDPSTGQPFTYREVPGGFELQSNYQVNNQPLKIVFPQPVH